MAACPDDLRKRFEVLILESFLLDALIDVGAKMRIAPHSHRAFSKIMLASQVKLGMIDERHAIVIRVLQPEIDVSAASTPERFDRIFVLPGYALHSLGELGEGLLANGK